MNISLRKKLFLLVFVILSGNGILGYAVYNSNQKLLLSEQWIRHTEQVMDQSNKILSMAKDIQTEAREFSVNNDNAFLKPLYSSQKTIIVLAKRLRFLTRDNPSQQVRIDSLDVYLNRPVTQSKYFTAGVGQILSNIQHEESVLLNLRKLTNTRNLMVFNRFLIVVFILIAVFNVFLIVATGKYLLQNIENGRRAAELVIANVELCYQNTEKEKRAAELIIADEELLYQSDEKEKRAAELVIANRELWYQSDEKKKRAGELVIANEELLFQNDEKEKRAAELVIANDELLFQNDEKEKRAGELVIANQELLFQNDEKEKRAAELFIANKELLFQNSEKEKRAGELVIANKELLFQNDERGKRAAELAIINMELLFQNREKEKRAAELVIANEELWYQNNEKEMRAEELVVANQELFFQNGEKEKRAAELAIANKELFFQNDEKEKRAAELIVANVELLFQNNEKEKRALELADTNEELLFQNEERKTAQKNLSLSESRLKEAQAISHIGNFDIDMVNYSDDWSDGMYKIYGLEKGAVTPSTELFLSFIHPEDLASVGAIVNESYDRSQSFVANFRFIHTSGNIRYGYLEANFEFDQDKNPIRLFGILQDVTAAKLADIERTKMVNDLMSRNNDLEQFAYIISHNLRAPVANIIGASDTLKDPGLSQTDKETLHMGINKSVLRLDDVIKDLNQILEIKGGINENKEMVHFSALVDNIKTSIANMIDKYQIDITYDFSEINKILTLKPYLYSIFYNLISNSVKYRRQDIAGIIEIKSHKLKNSIELIFTDNGMGINLDKKGAEVFGLYKRFHEDIEGKGMGLYMVKTQVEALGGKIGILSKVNEGTEFKIEFAA